MFLERLSLKNFKSFGGSHELALAPGFTAVVGPNGSGKSNLLDALRWVLGDGNASRLRITRLGDLAFQGSASLSRSTEAEVSLRLREAPDPEAKGRGRACVLGRRLAPEEGGSLFFLDGARVRLQDIDEAKRSWKLEGDRFAFIGQGEVAEVVQQRPRERRVHLEALFGIDMYRRRRDEALEKLVTVGEELRRLEMLQGELEGRRRDIAPAVSRAEAARAVLSVLQDARRGLYWRRRQEAEEEQRELATLRSEQASLFALLAGWKRGWEGVRTRFEETIARQSEDADRLQEELRGGEHRREALGRRAFGAGSALRSQKERLEDLHRRHGEQEELRRHCLATLEEHILEAGRKEETLRELRSVLAEAEAVWRALHQGQTRERALRDEALAALAAAREEVPRVAGRLGALGRRWFAVSQEERECARDRDRLHREVEDGRKRLVRSEGDAADALRRAGDAYALCQSMGGDLQRERRELATLRHRAEELREQLQGNLYPRPVQHVLSAARLGRLAAHPVPALETFQCPPTLLASLDAYLGGRRFWLFVQDFAEAGRCIEQLKKAGAGRATFLPMEQAKLRRPDRRVTLPSQGVVGWALDLVTPVTPWEAGVAHLLGDLLVVETYAVGVDLVRREPRIPVVTLEGDVFLPGGTVSGGGTGREKGPMELRHQLGVAEEEIRERERRLTELEWSLKEAESRERTAAKLREETAQTCQREEKNLAGLRATEERVEQKLQSLEEERHELRLALGEEGRRLADARQRERSHRELLEGLPSAPEEQALEHQVTACRGDVALAEEKLRSAEALVHRETAALAQVDGALRGWLDERQKIEEEGRLQQEILRSLGRDAWELRKQKQLLEERLAVLQRQRHAVEKRAERAQLRARTAAERMEAARSAEERLARMERDLAREIDDLSALWEGQFPYPGQGAFEEPRPLEELRRTLREKERALRELGETDMGVLSEDRSLEERVRFLREQTQDVTRAREELQVFIADTDAQAGSLFSQALQGIDRRFNELFQRLFGGGEARLTLTEGLSLWDAGVEVVARPPGKKPQHLGQLSGGEQSLTGIALLFAAMEVAGSPLAVLDEVDAALDEANLKRFAALAEEYARSLQLIVMTHRRYTMERAQVLYGVTMSEPGLSQVVGVRLEDWS